MTKRHKDKIKRGRPDRHATNPATGGVELVGADLADEWEAKVGAKPRVPPGAKEASAEPAPGVGLGIYRVAEERGARRPDVEKSEETIKAVLDALEQGETLSAICRRYGMPSRPTWFRWMDADEPLRNRYAHARERLLDVMAEDILEISDDAAGDVVETEDGIKVQHEVVNRARLRVDSRKWLLSKLRPTVYGDAVAAVPPPAEDASDRRLSRIAELLAIALAKPDSVPAAPKPEEKL